MYRLLALLIMSAIVDCGFDSTVTKPLTLEDAVKANFGLPIYGINPISPYSQQLRTTLFHIASHDEVKVETYFATNEAPTKSIIRMTVYSLLKAGPDTPQGQVNIAWALNGVGSLCKRPVSFDNREPFEASSYSMCMYWMDTEYKQYVLYSNWSEAETLTFINSLIKVN